MKTKFSLSLNHPDAILEAVGGKGASLARLFLAGLPIPDGFHISVEAYKRFVALNDLQPRILEALDSIDDPAPITLENASNNIMQMFFDSPIPSEIADEIVDAYASLSTGIDLSVAVRSSATAEDLPDASFAGQQETYLNIHGAIHLLEAVKKCWASLWTARAIAYRIKNNIDQSATALAVVVQEMVDAEAAGILFTANPINGKRDEMVINASWGLGEAIVGGLVSPDIIIADKATSKVKSYKVAEKTVITVRTEKGTSEEPLNDARRSSKVLNDAQIGELIEIARKIESFYGAPQDIEWCHANGRFHVVQSRPITTLTKQTPLIPSKWILPKGAYAAMRNNIVELMADPLTPLFRTLGLDAVNERMKFIMDKFIGTPGLLPSEPIIAVNEYAYYNGSVRFGPMFKVVLDTGGIIKRMFTGAVERWTDEGRPKYMNTVQRWEQKQLKGLSNDYLLAGVRELTGAAVDAYLALVSGVIPAAWISEAWFTWNYKFIKRKGDPTAPTYLLGFESLPIKGEKALYDLAMWSRERPKLTEYLKNISTHRLAAQINDPNSEPEVNEWETWATRFQSHLREYGHMIYNLDFGNPTPADDPAPILDTFKLFLRGEGTNPYERQQVSADRRKDAVQTMLGRLKGRRLKSFQKNLERAQKYAPLREDGLADVGMGYPLIRRMLRILGSRFVSHGMIEQPDDIYWLTREEVENAASSLDRGLPLNALSLLIPERKAIWDAARQATPPMALPQMKLFGVDLMELKSGIKRPKGNTIKGVAASPGSVTAPACVITSPQDFSKMNDGEVLVAPLTTPAWTPLFARAAAVVTDIGGPLSHGSIVAREYGIPAVLGTGIATKRISEGQVVTVDGSAGTVSLENNNY